MGDGTNWLGALIGGAFDTINAGVNYKYTKELNKQNAELQHHYWNIQNDKTFAQNEQAADNADARTRALYNDLQSPEAMKQQLLDAGLNPALMYSQGGMGGSVQQGAQGAGGGSPQGVSTLGLQNIANIDPLKWAQINNLNADTKKKEEETENTKFDTELKKQQTKNEETQTKLNELKWEFEDVTFWSRYNNLYNQALKMQGDAQEAIANGTLAQESYETRLAQYTLDYIKTGCEIDLLKSKKDLSEAQKQEALAEARKLTEEIELIAAKTTFYKERTNQAIADTKLSEEQAEKILRSYSWKYFTKEDLFKAWNNLNGTAQAVSEFIPLTKIGQLVTETITKDSSGKITQTYKRKRPQQN